jgi:hypothetical protein
MNESTALMVSDFDTMQRVSLALYKSKYFGDVQSEAQAIVKVMAGSELGLPPFASMTGIHIIKGKPVLGSNVIATLVKNDPRYDYRIEQADETTCQIVWFENGTNVGSSFFTMKEAQAANLAGKDNWKKYPSDMLFARAISRGARRFAPGIFGGSPVYTPDELGADIDPEGYVVEVTPEPAPEKPEPVAKANEELLGHDGTAEAQANTNNKPVRKPKPQGNGNGNGNVDWRSKLQKGRQTLSTVCSIAANGIPTINSADHALAVLEKHFELPEDLAGSWKWEMTQGVTQAYAVRMFDAIDEHEKSKA